MKNKNCLLIASGIAVIGVLGGCTSAKNTNASNSQVSAVLLSQSPLVNCTLTNLNNGLMLMRVSNLTQASNYSVPPIKGSVVKFDCSRSVASDGTSVSVSIGQNNGALVPVSGNQYQQLYSNSGLNTIVISAMDSKGQSSNVSFKLPISCDPASTPPITMNLSNISFSQGSSGPGYLNINLPAASGGRGNSGDSFMYAIDLNGDGRFDDYQTQYWNTTTSYTNMYTLFNRVRTVSVTAFDTGCELEQTFTANIDFSKVLPAMQTGAMAQPASYYYVQGQIDTLSNSTDASETVHPFDAMEAPINNPLHVICSYRKGAFDIIGANTYSDGNLTSAESLLKQGIEIAWTVNDPGTGAGVVANTNNIPITKLNYKTAASPDALYSQWDYKMDSACTTNVVITRQQADQPCTGDQTGELAAAVTIQGTYSCPHLTASTNSVSRSVKITNGYFYCQTSATNNCIGGGGGGGGGQPPVPF
jgi:hypothetical protein